MRGFDGKISGEAQLVHSTCLPNAILFDHGAAVLWLHAVCCSLGVSLDALLHVHVPVLSNPAKMECLIWTFTRSCSTLHHLH